MVGLDINAKIENIKVLFLSEKDIIKGNYYRDAQGIYWPDISIYLDWISSGCQMRHFMGIDADYLGMVKDIERHLFDDMRWCIVRELTPESNPEYFI